MSKLIKFTLVLFLYANTLQAQSVHIKQGEILGFEKYGIKHFLGIPFAQAPIGNKRWQAPEWISNYQQPVDASEYGDICVQPNAKPEDNMSEDCLNLNIWTPSTKAKLPVMVWLHGGGFRTGSNRVLGTTFAAKGSVVVALNYRLGPLGFFAHPELNDKAANPGALDMVAGLQWVKQNIQYFGGDPENITLFGVSAGGMAVNLMVTNSKAKGLFHKAIAQSGYATWPLPRTPSVKQLPNTENAHVSAIKLIAKIDSNLTKDKQSIEVLQKLSALELVNAVDGFVLPIVDGHSVEEEPGVRFVKGLQNPVALMTGGNSFEGSVMPYSGMTESDYHVMLGKEHKNIKALYKEYDGLPQNLVNQLMWGDNRYLLSAQVTAKAMKKINQPSWLY